MIGCSVIVCVHNRPAALATCLSSLVSQLSQSRELVVVDDGSTEDVRQVVTSLRNRHTTLAITFLRHREQRGVSAARNTGIAATRGDIIAFLDSDCRAAPDWLDNLVHGLRRIRASAASGMVVDKDPDNAGELAHQGAGRIGVGWGQNRHLVGCNMAFDGAILRQYGFDPELEYGGDEDELAWRLRRDGHLIAFVRNAIVYHHHATTAMGYLATGWRLGRGTTLYLVKRRHFIGRDLWPTFLALATAPIAVTAHRLILIPLGFLGLQVVALMMNELIYKRKPFLSAITVLPLVTAHSFVKAASVLTTLVRTCCTRSALTSDGR
ncbi:MAG: glycosyltransferase [Gammaproteobacteria bacterium]|nr:glycosyltransferase [Gammaproteobacteria bacterium]